MAQLGEKKYQRVRGGRRSPANKEGKLSCGNELVRELISNLIPFYPAPLRLAWGAAGCRAAEHFMGCGGLATLVVPPLRQSVDKSARMPTELQTRRLAGGNYTSLVHENGVDR